MRNSVIQQLKESADLKNLIAQTLADVIVKAAKAITETYIAGGKLLLIGNGGSAADAQHIAGEMVGRFQLKRNGLSAIALTTDSSIITAVANDYGYDYVFSRQVEALANKGDVLMAITTSGTSSNVLKAVETARAKEVQVIGLTGHDGGKLKEISDITIVVPSNSTPRIQEAHITIGHILCGLVETELAKNQAYPRHSSRRGD